MRAVIKPQIKRIRKSHSVKRKVLKKTAISPDVSLEQSIMNRFYEKYPELLPLVDDDSDAYYDEDEEDNEYNDFAEEDNDIDDEDEEPEIVDLSELSPPLHLVNTWPYILYSDFARGLRLARRWNGSLKGVAILNRYERFQDRQFPLLGREGYSSKRFALIFFETVLWKRKNRLRGFRSILKCGHFNKDSRLILNFRKLYSQNFPSTVLTENELVYGTNFLVSSALPIFDLPSKELFSQAKFLPQKWFDLSPFLPHEISPDPRLFAFLNREVLKLYKQVYAWRVALHLGDILPEKIYSKNEIRDNLRRQIVHFTKENSRAIREIVDLMRLYTVADTHPKRLQNIRRFLQWRWSSRLSARKKTLLTYQRFKKIERAMLAERVASLRRSGSRRPRFLFKRRNKKQRNAFNRWVHLNTLRGSCYYKTVDYENFCIQRLRNKRVLFYTVRDIFVRQLWNYLHWVEFASEWAEVYDHFLSVEPEVLYTMARADVYTSTASDWDSLLEKAGQDPTCSFRLVDDSYYALNDDNYAEEEEKMPDELIEIADRWWDNPPEVPEEATEDVEGTLDKEALESEHEFKELQCITLLDMDPDEDDFFDYSQELPWPDDEVLDSLSQSLEPSFNRSPLLFYKKHHPLLKFIWLRHPYREYLMETYFFDPSEDWTEEDELFLEEEMHVSWDDAEDFDSACDEYTVVFARKNLLAPFLLFSVTDYSGYFFDYDYYVDVDSYQNSELVYFSEDVPWLQESVQEELYEPPTRAKRTWSAARRAAHERKKSEKQQTE